RLLPGLGVEERVHGFGAVAALADGPDDERLAASHIAAGENAVATGPIIAHRCFDIALRRQRDTRTLERAFPSRTEKTHRQEDELGLDLELGAGDRLDLLAAVGPVDELGAGALKPRNFAILADERL